MSFSSYEKVLQSPIKCFNYHYHLQERQKPPQGNVF